MQIQANFKSLTLLASALCATATVAVLGFTDTNSVAPVIQSARQAARDDDHQAVRADGSESRRRLQDEAAPVTAKGFFRAPVGSEFRYQMRARMRTTIGSTDAPQANELGFHLAGPVVLTVVARRESPGENGDVAEEMVVQWTCPDLEVRALNQGSSNDGHAAVIRQDLGLAQLVHMDTDGRVLGYRFAAAMHRDNRAFVRTLVSSLSFVVDRQAQVQGNTSWTSTEIDNTAEASFDYRWLGSKQDYVRRLQRQLVGYRALDVANGRDQAQTSGLGTASLELQTGYLTQARTEHQMTVAIADMNAVIGHEHSVEASLIARSWSAVPAFDWDDITWGPVSGVEDAKAHAAERTVRKRQEMLKGATLQSLVQEIRQILAIDPIDAQALFMAREKLAWLIEANPEVLEQLGPLVRRVTQEGDLVAVLMAAVGATQLQDGQAFLAGFLGDRKLDDNTRMMSAASMYQLREPSQEVVALVQDLNRRSDTPDLRNTNLMLLGQMAGTRHGGAALSQLQDMEPEVDESNLEQQDVEKLVDWLMAMGNAVSEKTLPTLAKYTNHTSARVRTAAVGALGGIASQDATQLLVAATQDADIEVRATALRHLGPRTSKLAVDALVVGATQEQNGNVRGVAIKALGEIDDPARRAALAGIAKNDENENLRQLAREILDSFSQAR